MTMQYDPNNWYWIVAGSTTHVYSSASQSYVSVSDSTYLAWVASGGEATPIASEALLYDVLNPETPSAIERDLAEGTIDPTDGGPWTFTAASGKFFPIGGTLYIRPFSDQTIAVIGEVKAYSGTSLTVSLRATNATVSQTYDLWSISLLDAPPAKLPLLSIVGLVVTQNDSDPHSLDISPGSVMDSTGAALLTLGSTLTVDMESAFNDGSGVNGILSVSLSGTITSGGGGGLNVTGSGTTFSADFASASNADYIAQGGAVSAEPIIAVASVTSSVNAVTNNTALTSSTQLGASSSAYTRGGIFSNTVAGNAVTYFMALIRRDSDGAIRAGLTSATPSGSPDLPTGYTLARTLARVTATRNAVAANSTIVIEQPLYTSVLPLAGRLEKYVLWPDATSDYLPNALPLTSFDSTSVQFSGASNTFIRAALTGDVTASANSNSTTIANGAVTYAKIASGVVRDKLTANRTYYVRTDGSDSNTGLVDNSGGAFLTIAAALTAASALDCSTYNCTIQVRSGTRTAAVNLPMMTGTGTFTLTGDTGTPSNCIISVTGNNCIGGSDAGRWTVSGFRVQTTTSGVGLYAIGRTTISFSAIDFGTIAGAHQGLAEQGGRLVCTGNYSISGASAYAHLTAASLGFVNAGFSRTVTVSASVTFSVFAYSSAVSVLTSSGNTYSLGGGVTVTAQRYLADENAVIKTFTAGASYFPGSTDGATATGGQYT